MPASCLSSPRSWKRSGRISVPSFRTELSCSGSSPSALWIVGATCEVATGVLTAGTQIRVGDDETDVGVTEAETAVLGVLFRRGCVNRTVNRLHENVGCAAVLRGAIEFEL